MAVALTSKTGIRAKRSDVVRKALEAAAAGA
jgi:hypothetical protein